MAKQTKNQIKSYFQKYDKPTEQQFSHLFDSIAFKSGSNGLTGSLIISGSTSDNANGEPVDLNVMGNITSSGNISASGNIIANTFTISGNISSSGNLIVNNITASGGISASKDIGGSNLSVPSIGKVQFKGPDSNTYWTSNGGATSLKLVVNGSERMNITPLATQIDNTLLTKLTNGSLLVQNGNISSSGGIKTMSHITASGNISASGDLEIRNITASGTISASGRIMATSLLVGTGINNHIGGNVLGAEANKVNFFQPVTASSDISASRNIEALTIVGRRNALAQDNSGGAINATMTIANFPRGSVIGVTQTTSNNAVAYTLPDIEAGLEYTFIATTTSTGTGTTTFTAPSTRLKGMAICKDANEDINGTNFIFAAQKFEIGTRVHIVADGTIYHITAICPCDVADVSTT